MPPPPSIEGGRGYQDIIIESQSRFGPLNIRTYSSIDNPSGSNDQGIAHIHCD